MKKICRKCNKEKPLTEFYKQADMRDGYRHNCKRCHLDAHRCWYEKNREYEIDRVNTWRKRHPTLVKESRRRRRAADPEGHRSRDREGHLRRKYGLTQNMFESLVLAQLGHCAICGVSEGMELHVDHDHRTKKVRGLLCGKCNKAIGLLNDDPQLLMAAKLYLERAERFWSASV